MADITTAPDTTIPPVPFTPAPSYGWVCPLCGQVHAPFVTECHCVPPKVTSNILHARVPKEYFDDV